LYQYDRKGWFPLRSQYPREAEKSSTTVGKYWVMWDIPFGMPPGAYQCHWRYRMSVADTWHLRSVTFALVQLSRTVSIYEYLGGTVYRDVTVDTGTGVISVELADGSIINTFDARTTMMTANESISVGQPVYLQGDLAVGLAHRTELSSARFVGIALSAASSGDQVLVQTAGITPSNLFREDDFTVGTPVYVGNTPGTLSNNPPTLGNGVMFEVGLAATSSAILIRPSSPIVF